MLPAAVAGALPAAVAATLLVPRAAQPFFPAVRADPRLAEVSATLIILGAPLGILLAGEVVGARASCPVGRERRAGKHTIFCWRVSVVDR